MKGNVIVGQSGGPTAVINSSLAGVYKTALACGAGKVYGMRYGIEGLLNEKYVDLSEHLKSDLDVEILKHTPASYLGTCRYKLPPHEGNEELYEKIFTILDKLEIEVFTYIGGNDSMDTIKQLSDYAAANGKSQRFMGVPKTIDNDLPITDHTPGFGSAAKYIATSVKEVICDGRGFANTPMVTIIEIMGRNAGWLTAAAALAKTEDCEGVDLIYLPEVAFDTKEFVEEVREIMKKKSTVFVAISEGIRTADGTYISEMGGGSDYVDAFGHKQLAGSATYLANLIGSELGCKTRGIEFSTLQRCASHMASLTDINEAFMAGAAAVKAADEGETGKMPVIERVSDYPYRTSTSVYDIHKIANVEKMVPREWINEKGNGVTEDFIRYARPLIQGEFAPIVVDGLPVHLRLNDGR
ncbi:pyrophosphate--fructose 6-phosphate 1-phosphotransferase [Lachnospiraceae bacterium]|nr:pyrophosphate--fructose 6-phosphate 1-phosphotransferase [Lachnospiraceae bacterium]